MDLTFYSGLEHMTILGHQQGSPNMLAPLRTHCAEPCAVRTAYCLCPVT